jgi:hypothetical protein
VCCAGGGSGQQAGGLSGVVSASKSSSAWRGASVYGGPLLLGVVLPWALKLACDFTDPHSLRDRAPCQLDTQ